MASLRTDSSPVACASKSECSRSNLSGWNPVRLLTGGRTCSQDDRIVIHQGWPPGLPEPASTSTSRSRCAGRAPTPNGSCAGFRWIDPVDIEDDKNRSPRVTLHERNAEIREGATVGEHVRACASERPRQTPALASTVVSSSVPSLTHGPTGATRGRVRDASARHSAFLRAEQPRPRPRRRHRRSRRLRCCASPGSG